MAPRQDLEKRNPVRARAGLPNFSILLWAWMLLKLFLEQLTEMIPAIDVRHRNLDMASPGSLYRIVPVRCRAGGQNAGFGVVGAGGLEFGCLEGGGGVVFVVVGEVCWFGFGDWVGAGGFMRGAVVHFLWGVGDPRMGMLFILPGMVGYIYFAAVVLAFGLFFGFLSCHAEVLGIG